MQFARLNRPGVVADLGGGVMTLNAGALLPVATDRAIELVDRFARLLLGRTLPWSRGAQRCRCGPKRPGEVWRLIQIVCQ